MSGELTHKERDRQEDMERSMKGGCRVPLDLGVDMLWNAERRQLFLGVGSTFAQSLRWIRRCIHGKGPVIALMAAGDRMIDDIQALAGVKIVLVSRHGTPLKKVEVREHDLFMFDGASLPAQWAMVRLSEAGSLGQIISLTDTSWHKFQPFCWWSKPAIPSSRFSFEPHKQRTKKQPKKKK